MIDRVRRNEPSKNRDRRDGKSKGDSGRRYRGYVRPTAETVTSRANRKSAGFETIFKNNVDRFSYEKGDNPLRICPPTFDDNPNNHYFMQVFVHPRQGSDNSDYLCLSKNKWIGKPCPFCDAEKDARGDEDADEAKRLKPVEQWVGWVLPREGDNANKPHAFKASFTQDRDLASLCQGRKGNMVFPADPDNGFDICIRRNGSGLNTKYLISIDRESTPLLENGKKQDQLLDWLEENPISGALEVKKYEYLEQIIKGVVEEKDEDLDEDEEGSGSKRRGDRSRDEEDNEEEEARSDKRRRGGPKKDEDENEEDIEEEEEEEEDGEVEEEKERHPRRGSKGRKEEEEEETEDEEEEDDGEEEDDEEHGSHKRPSSKGHRGKSDEDDGDDDRPTARRSGGRRDGDDDDNGDDDDAKPTRRGSSRRR